MSLLELDAYLTAHSNLSDTSAQSHQLKTAFCKHETENDYLLTLLQIVHLLAALASMSLDVVGSLL